MSEPPPLVVGLVLESLVVPAWHARVVSSIVAAPFATVTLVVLGAERAGAVSDSLAARPGRDGLFKLYARVDRRLFGRAPDAWADVDVSSLLAGVPNIRIVRTDDASTGANGDRSRLSDAIRDADLDVVVDLGRRPLAEEARRHARYGVWSYRVAGAVGATNASFFRPMYERNPVVTTTLTVWHRGDGREHVLYRSVGASHTASLSRSSDAALWKSAEFALRRLADLRRRGWGYIEESPEYQETLAADSPVDVVPTNREMVEFAARSLYRVSERRLRRRLSGHEAWFVAHRRVSPDGCEALDRIVAPAAGAAGRFRFIPSPSGHYYADPFVVEHDGCHYLFVEDYCHATSRAVIAWTHFAPDGQPAELRVALERPYHLSYPFLFYWDGAWYMMPETGANRRVELYRAEHFPDSWTLDRVLLDDIFAVDPTLLEKDGKWWLFLNVAVPGASINDELCVFYSDSPLGPWAPHPLNPVVSDVRHARPAGRLFWHKERLIRPAQDSSTRYGSAIALNHVTTLTVDDYSEVTVDRVGPEWMRGNLATHTVNADHAYQVVDAVRRSPKGR